MKRRRPVFSEGRILSVQEAAAYLGRSTSWLASHAPELEKAGFPRPLPMVGGYDKQSLDTWIDRLGGNGETSDFRSAWMGAFDT